MKLKKMKATLKARQDHFKATEQKGDNSGRRMPGSLNPHKSFPTGQRRRK